MSNASLTRETEMDLVRSAWYSHDARWFNAVAEEFGMETANRLNQRAVLALGNAEARRLAKVLGVQSCETLDTFYQFLEAGRSVYVPSAMIDLSIAPIDESSYGIAVSHCFVADNIRRAGIADSYECAVFHRVHAWHDALGLPLAEAPAALPCALAQGRPCRRTMTIGHPAGPIFESRSDSRRSE